MSVAPNGASEKERKEDNLRSIDQTSQDLKRIPIYLISNTSMLRLKNIGNEEVVRKRRKCKVLPFNHAHTITPSG